MKGSAGWHKRTDSTISRATPSQSSTQSHVTYELGPHPADPHSTILPASSTTSTFHAPSYSFHASPASRSNTIHDRFPTSSCIQKAFGQELWVYCGTGGLVYKFDSTSFTVLTYHHFRRTFTFWRFLIQIPTAQNEMTVYYSINNGQRLEFWVPGRNQNMRWAAHSVCGLFISQVW